MIQIFVPRMENFKYHTWTWHTFQPDFCFATWNLWSAESSENLLSAETPKKKDKKINPAIDLRLKFWCRSWRSPFCGLRLFEAKKFNNVVQNSHQTINVFDEPGRFQIIDCICSVGIMLHSWIFFQTVCSDSIRVHHSWIRSLVSWNNILEQWHGKKLGTFLTMTFR